MKIQFVQNLHKLPMMEKHINISFIHQSDFGRLMSSAEE